MEVWPSDRALFTAWCGKKYYSDDAVDAILVKAGQHWIRNYSVDGIRAPPFKNTVKLVQYAAKAQFVEGAFEDMADLDYEMNHEARYGPVIIALEWMDNGPTWSCSRSEKIIEILHSMYLDWVTERYEARYLQYGKFIDLLVGAIVTHTDELRKCADRIHMIERIPHTAYFKARTGPVSSLQTWCLLSRGPVDDATLAEHGINQDGTPYSVAQISSVKKIYDTRLGQLPAELRRQWHETRGMGPPPNYIAALKDLNAFWVTHVESFVEYRAMLDAELTPAMKPWWDYITTGDTTGIPWRIARILYKDNGRIFVPDDPATDPVAAQQCFRELKEYMENPTTWTNRLAMGDGRELALKHEYRRKVDLIKQRDPDIVIEPFDRATSHPILDAILNRLGSPGCGLMRKRRGSEEGRPKRPKLHI